MTSLRRRAALAAALAAAACSAPRPVEPAPQASAVAPAEVVSPPPLPLELALESVDAERIAADVAFLADDLLQGRDSPSDGLRISAGYLLARLAGLGFEPGSNAGFRPTFQLESRRIDPALTRARWSDEELDLVFARDFAVHPSDGRSATTRGALVFAGRGREQDLAACDLQGRWALVVGQRTGRRRALQRDVRAAGALGLVCVAEPDEDVAPGEPPEVFATWRELAERLRPREPRAEDDAPFATLWLAPGAEARVAGLAPGSLLAAELELEVAGGGLVPVENVAALWRGAHPERAREVIVLSAHYDHVGVERGGAVMNGADDNASGSAALLAVGEALARRGPLDRSVLLLWVGAEEIGLLGSAAWCRAPDLPEGLTPVANVNLDMVGRNAPDYVEMTPSPEHAAWGPLAALAAELVAHEGFQGPTWIDRDFERSDQASFHRILGLPVVYVSTGEHADYHESTDDSDKIDADKIARVTRLVLRLLEGAQALALEPQAPQAAGEPAVAPAEAESGD